MHFTLYEVVVIRTAVVQAVFWNAAIQRLLDVGYQKELVWEEGSLSQPGCRSMRCFVSGRTADISEIRRALPKYVAGIGIASAVVARCWFGPVKVKHVQSGRGEYGVCLCLTKTALSSQVVVWNSKLGKGELPLTTTQSLFILIVIA